MGKLSEADKHREEELCADLREDYLRTVAALKNHHVHVKMHRDTSISGSFQIIHGNSVILKDVETPVGEVQNAAFLRTKDIITMTFDAKKK